MHLRPDAAFSRGTRRRAAVCSLTLLCALSAALAHAQLEDFPLESRHVGLGIATLVPVTEASVWKSNCKPAEQPTLRAIRSQILALPSLTPNDTHYSGLHVRAAILSDTETIFVAEGMHLKVVGHLSVQYKQVAPAGGLATLLLQAFRTCL
jgi:hypothetical protein